MTQPLIGLKNVSFRYEQQLILKHIDFTLNPGEFWALIGPNGSGKSTMIQLILGLLEPTEGEVKLFGQPNHSFKERDKIGFVSQKSNSFNSTFPATVFEVVRSGLTKKKGLFRSFHAKDHEKVMEALRLVHMEDFSKRPIGALSGGQQQRVFIARALVSDPELLIMDEPTVGIDQENVKQFYQLIEQLNEQQGIAILLVTHEIDLVTSLASHVACLNQEMHFHGGQKQYEQMEDDDVSKWYGHPVKRVHGGDLNA